ncbi:hypothetical protein [Dyella sp. Tek66A03]|uniref:hypothetical protein n=1 Tax=Dyella sp. Tek66A03 TaxID=3458298 RepID=UPI00403E948A
MKRHFGCSRMAPLNAQLLFPLTPFEAFEFGENPPPLPLRIAPRVFEQAHNLGRNPDGAFTIEIHGPAAGASSNGVPRFNLYQRVTQRVPESKYWLLKEFEPYLRVEPPPIGVSIGILQQLLKELGLVLVDVRAIAAWEYICQAWPQLADFYLVDELMEGSIPEYLILIFTLCHLAVWHLTPRADDLLARKLVKLCADGVANFVNSLEGYGLSIDVERDQILLSGLLDAKDAIAKHGARSLSAIKEDDLPRLSTYLILVPDTEANHRAIQCLNAAVHLQGGGEFVWPEDLRDRAAQREIEFENRIGMKPRDAAEQLTSAAFLVPQLLRSYADKTLAGYEPPQAGTQKRGQMRVGSLGK